MVAMMISLTWTRYPSSGHFTCRAPGGRGGVGLEWEGMAGSQGCHAMPCHSPKKLFRKSMTVHTQDVASRRIKTNLVFGQSSFFT